VTPSTAKRAHGNPAIPEPNVPEKFHTFRADEYEHQFGTTTTEASEAIPSEVYSDLLLEAAYAPDNLRDAIAATTVDLTARDGDTVSVLAMPTRTASTVSEGSAVSDSADDPTETPITLTKWGTRNDVTRETLEDSAVIGRQQYIANLMAALNDQVNARIANRLNNSSNAGTTVDLASAGVLADVYDKAVSAKQSLKGNDMRPDMVLMHPDVEEQFLKDERVGTAGENITVQDGSLTRIAGMSVRVSSHFNALNQSSGTVLSTVIDSSRALGSAWGRQPEVIEDETTSADTDEVRLIAWMRYETEIIDTTAVGMVQNP
jgi:hypothetical protein